MKAKSANCERDRRTLIFISLEAALRGTMEAFGSELMVNLLNDSAVNK